MYVHPWPYGQEDRGQWAGEDRWWVVVGSAPVLLVPQWWTHLWCPSPPSPVVATLVVP